MSKITPEEQAKIEIIITMAQQLSPQAKLSSLEDIFGTLDPDSMVDFTDFCNKRMGAVVSHKFEIAGRMVGKKAGELLDSASKNINNLANQFSKEMGKQRGDKDTWSDVDNPYRDSEPKP
jgi:hypothetical protein